MARSTAAQVATVVRVRPAGPFVELDGSPGYELGPCPTVVDGLNKGDRVLVVPLARDPDDFAVLGRLL